MKAHRVDEYHKYGCNFYGKLAVIDYTKEWESHPRYGQFASMSVFDAAEDAVKFAKERYPNHTVLLNIPELVIRIV